MLSCFHIVIQDFYCCSSQKVVGYENGNVAPSWFAAAVTTAVGLAVAAAMGPVVAAQHNLDARTHNATLREEETLQRLIVVMKTWKSYLHVVTLISNHSIRFVQLTRSSWA